MKVVTLIEWEIIVKFSQISINWRGRPLTSHEVIVNLIGSTRTRKGLKQDLIFRAYLQRQPRR